MKHKTALPKNVRRKRTLRSVIAAGVMLGLTACGTASNAQSDSANTEAAIKAGGFDAKQRAAIDAMIREYILENPEIIPEAVQILRQRQVAERLAPIRSQVETPYESAWAGNPNGDVTIVEYYDYNCGYCAQSVAHIEQLLKEDKNVKVVYRELPILGETSNQAAVMSLAAAKQGKYNEFHKALFAAGKPSAATIRSAAQKAGLDMNAATSFAQSAEARSLIEKNLEVARTLEFSGTPSWVIGDQTFSSALGVEGLRDAVAKARANKAKK